MFAYSSVGKEELMFQFEKTINANDIIQNNFICKVYLLPVNCQLIDFRHRGNSF